MKQHQKNQLSLNPRWIRLGVAPSYMGMDKNRFNKEVRPYLIEIPIGKQGIAFDRVDLDDWMEEYKSRCGRSPKRRGNLLCQSESQVSINEAQRASGTLINASKDMDDFTRALAQVTTGKRSNT